jgi:hypothetical protein
MSEAEVVLYRDGLISTVIWHGRRLKKYSTAFYLTAHTLFLSRYLLMPHSDKASHVSESANRAA